MLVVLGFVQKKTNPYNLERLQLWNKTFINLLRVLCEPMFYLLLHYYLILYFVRIKYNLARWYGVDYARSYLVEVSYTSVFIIF